MLTEKELGDRGETTGCWEPSQKMALVEAAERGLVSRDKGNRVWLQEQLLWTAGESILERGGWGGGWSEEPRKSVCGSISRAQSLRLEGSVFFSSLRTLVPLGPECSVLECHWKGWIKSVLIPEDARCPEVR